VRACVAFDAAAWRIPEARHAASTLATLLETPSRIAAPGERARDGEAIVFVGAREAAPADAAAVIEVRDWPALSARTLVATSLGGVELPTPHGTDASHDARIFPPEWLRATAWLLGREEEYQDERRDQWQCYSGAYTRLADIGLLDRPLVNLQAQSLERAIERHAASRGAQLEREPRWPNGARFAVALSHDVDDVTLRSFRSSMRLLRQARGPASYAFRAGLSGLKRALLRAPGSPDPYWTFERWMTEEERHGFRSTFYFCPEPAQRHEYDPLYRLGDVLGYDGRRITVTDLIADMTRRGHEVGLHGSYQSYRDARELARQREAIAAATPAGGDAVRGIRQHFLRFDVRTTWAAQAEAGFTYDSTLGYNEAIGFRAGIAAPFVPWDAGGRIPHRLWEAPLTAMDGALFRTLGLGGEAAADRVRAHLETVEAAGGLAVLLWHPNATYTARFPGWWDCYARTLAWLEGRPAYVAPVGAVVRGWAERAARMSGTESAAAR